MINSYKKITTRYLKANRKRTLLTIIGIVLSVALISTIGLFFKGIQDSEIQSYKDDYGSFHLIYNNLNSSVISKIINNPSVARSGFVTLGEEIKINSSQKTQITIATDKALELLPCKIKEGRLPNSKNEIAMERWIQRNLFKDAKLNSKVILNGKEYKLVGILNDGINSQLQDGGLILTKDNNIDKEKSSLLVELNSKANFKDVIPKMKSLVSKKNVIENSYLLMGEGYSSNNDSIRSIYSTIGIIIGIVVIATIAVIYNSFQISVVERIKQFGLLRAVGATPKQIRKIVLGEASILALIGIPIGLLCSIVAIYGIYFAFKLIGGSTVESIMMVSVSPKIMLLSTIVGIVSIYISALIPAIFAGRLSPLVAISSRSSINKEKIKRRKNIIVKKLFGFEGELASKNIKRNRKRYRVTVFSIVISVVLFISFKFFADMTLNLSPKANESKNIHFTVLTDFNTEKDKEAINNDLLKSLSSISYVNNIFTSYNPYSVDAVMDKNNEVKAIHDINNVYKDINYNGKAMTLLPASINVYDEAALKVSKKYLQSGNIDIDSLNKEDGVILINDNRVYNEKAKKTFVSGVSSLKAGDYIYVQNEDVSSSQQGADVKFGNGKVIRLKVLAVLKSEPFDFNSMPGNLKLISTEYTAKKLFGEKSLTPSSVKISIKNPKDEAKALSSIENVTESNTSLRVINELDENRQRKSGILMVEILLYGFVIVISLISSVNIINTLTTNLILRRREFATLKSIGLTQKGLKKMIVLEGLLYGIMGALYGSIIGTGFSYLIYKGMSNVRGFQWKIPMNSILIAAAFALGIGYFSVLSPLARIKKDNLIDTMREEN